MTADWRPAAELELVRGRRLDRRIPAFLLRSPISRAGYWWGTAVGWVWGSLWSTGRVERRGWLTQFTSRRACDGGCFLTGDARPSDAVLRHEAVHKQQWLRYGMLLPVLYLFAGRNPLRNRFEIEAGLEDGNYVRRAGAQRSTGRSPKRSGT